ncbi:MAG: anthranilate phosphoribosyltransferase [Rhodospirillales bacterium]|nr:anthranilate phosphoribosyltransferase [Rhodospirillales bacterium]MCB9995633.1 anthranilate phosphoribosyltransferase [Rhodospirillales bacterium]
MSTSLITDRSLTESEMAAAMHSIMDGQASAEDMAAFLTAMAQRGETVDEITGAAKVMREKASTINAPADALDCCGTGGDGIGTYNISTAVALVAAACGVPIAKHGNRAASSKSGAADVLEALGVNLDTRLEKLEQALAEIGFCFLMAPRHHEAVKHVVPVRKQLGFRTIFNLLGPLANPAGTKFQLIGVYDKHWLVPMAETLDRLGTQKAWLVHGHDGLDEITVTGPTDIAILDHGTITTKTLTPEDFGLPVSPADDLRGGMAEENAAALTALLQGKPSAYRDIVLANTAAVLNIHGNTALKDAAAQAAAAIDEGKAIAVLNRYKEFTA